MVSGYGFRCRPIFAAGFRESAICIARSRFLYGRSGRSRTCDPLVPNQVRFQLRHAPRGVDEWQTLKDSNLGMLGSKPSAVDRLAKRLHLVAEGGFEPTDLWLMRPAGTARLPYSAIALS